MSQNIIYIIILNQQSQGYPNALYWSTNGGQDVSWNSSITIYPSNFDLNTFVNTTGQYLIIANNLYSGQGDGKTYTSKNFAADLDLTDLPLTNNNRGVSCRDDGSSFVACIYEDGLGNGGIYYSTDGTTFGKVTIPNSQPYFNIMIGNATGEYLCVLNGNGVSTNKYIYYSHNHGVSWQISDAPFLNWYTFTCSYNGQYFYAVVSGGYIYRSTNYGVNWEITNSPSLNWIYIKSNPYGNKIIAYDYDNNNTYSSSDYGVNWYSISSTLPNTTFQYYIAATNTSANNFLIPPGVTPNNIYMLYDSYVPCFAENTKILCFDTSNSQEIYMPIQNIRKGTFVKTLKHGYVPVDRIGKTTMPNFANKDRIVNRLYKCTKENYPEMIDEELIITGSHSVLIDNFLNEEQKQKTIHVLGEIYGTDGMFRLPACVDERAQPYEAEGTYTIYHFSLENINYYMNYGVYANGLLVETCSKRYLREISNMILI